MLLLATVFVALAISVSAQFTEYIPLVPCNISAPCSYQGQFSPNGTLYPGDISYYGVDMTLFDSSSVLYVEPDSMSYGSLSFYVAEGNLPEWDDDDGYDQMNNANCSDVYCDYLAETFGVCNSPGYYWYIAVVNDGNEDVSFTFSVVVSSGYVVPYDCTNNSFNWGPVIIFSYCSPFLCLILCCGLALCVVRRRRCRSQGYCVVEERNPNVQVVYQVPAAEPVVYYQYQNNAPSNGFHQEAPPPYHYSVTSVQSPTYYN